MFRFVLGRIRSIFAALLIAVTPTLVAAGQDVAANGAAGGPAIEAREGGHHQSVIKLQDGPGNQRRNVHVGLGKSVLIETPRPVRDVMVSNPAAVDAVVLSTNRIFLLARKFGESNAFIFDENGEQFATLEVFVERETSGLEGLLRRLISGSNIRVEMLNRSVVLTGSVRTPVDANRATSLAKQFVTVDFESKVTNEVEGVAIKNVSKDDNELVINMLSVEGEEQVMLRVQVAEVQRSLLKQLGVNLGAAITAGNFSTALLTANALPLTAAAGLGGLPIPGISTGGDPTDPSIACPVGALCNINGGPNGSTFGNSGLSGGGAFGDTRVTHAIRALERAGLVRTLAEPNLTAISGESAKFLAGGEFPIPVADGQGGISVTFKEFGVGVAFTPTVMSEGRISLKIETEVSELTNVGSVVVTGFSIPALKKRQAKSTVELPSGGSLAMAGLISDEVRQNIDGLPGLKDLPVLGTLFRSRDFIKQETELVVIVTPYIVKPTARQELARPLDGLGEATDLKANFLGHLNRIYGDNPNAPQGDLKGDHGFIVE